ncbi:MAG: efflux RND transporter periplasmic adaptor subunit [bacterium]|nr:efflux RND transporter periplasmic adaptor subunit [bacterium]
MHIMGLSTTRKSSGALLPLIGLLLILCVAGCNEPNTDTEIGMAEVPRNVRVLTLAEGDLSEYLTIYGPASALRGTVLSAEESGQVKEIPRDKGQRIGEGDAIVVLDRALLATELQAAEAQAELASFNARKTRKLFDANSVSEIEWLDAKTSNLQAKASVKAIKLRYDRAATTAPFAGIVTDRYVELGQMVAPGQPVARIVDPYTLKLESSVTEREVTQVKRGAKAIVEFENQTHPVEGVVHWVGFEADPASGKFPVEIRINNSDLILHPGIIAHARILKQQHLNVIRIPRDAVVQQTTGPVAFVEENGVARKRILELGIDQGLMVIVESGLRAGDRLLVRGQRDVREGVAVAVQEETLAADGSLAVDPATVLTRGTKDGQAEGAIR